MNGANAAATRLQRKPVFNSSLSCSRYLPNNDAGVMDRAVGNSTLSALLEGINLHGHNWTCVHLREASGVSVPAGFDVMVHVVVEGRPRFASRTHAPVVIKPGDVVIVLSGEAHAIRDRADGDARVLEAFRDDGDPDADAAAESIVGDRGSIVARLLCGRLRLSHGEEIARSAFPPLLLLGAEIDTDPWVAEWRRQHMRSFGLEPGAAAHLTKLAASMLIRGLRYDPTVQCWLNRARGISPIRRSLQLMSENPGADWSIERLARAVGMGRSAFSSRFLADVGRSPMQVLTERRLTIADSLLRGGNLTIADISSRVGYQSESSFSRCFLRHFAESPGSVRGVGAAPRSSARQMQSQ